MLLEEKKDNISVFLDSSIRFLSSSLLGFRKISTNGVEGSSSEFRFLLLLGTEVAVLVIVVM